MPGCLPPGVRLNSSINCLKLVFVEACIYDTRYIMNNPQKQTLLQQIAAIPTMERGKLSTFDFKERPGVSGPYHKLQHWHQGKNQTRYVSAEELPQLKAALAGYEHYQQLTGKYADLVIGETREAMAESKKNRTHRNSALLRTKKSKD
jgi:hypothetical protein